MTDLLQTGEYRARPKLHIRVPDEPAVSLIREDIYAVLAPRETMGFIERVGNVFVSLSGPDLARAVEVCQTLSWDIAVAAVQRAYHARA